MTVINSRISAHGIPWDSRAFSSKWAGFWGLFSRSRPGTPDALSRGMNTKFNLVELITSVVGLSFGVGFGAATLLIGFAALVQ
jgi:hypothetical protein